ncbi:sensor histidine kinase [Salinispora tropica]|uniref:histidine kinase n=1 Tax=Salinispora tropica (strain ATCC BAA-916 / DSM 44818 / JCM 13857 / NBRC 105044 / CNB-440) TaxID=369723 RepID=A4X1Y1_SALTO|nr:histidine kinase [Salinispora tropica]ABP52881.1 integral membrane sensor signal transduction histidine kinase [Salinispora tropica CNB-440]
MTSAAVSEHSWLLPGTLTAPTARARRTLRDWFVDSLCFLAAFGWAVVAWDNSLSAEPAMAMNVGPSWLNEVDFLASLVLCGALWVRRRWPVGLALASLPLALFTVSGDVALLIILFTVSVHRPFPVAASMFGVHLLAIPIYLWLRHDPVMSLWLTVGWILLCLGAVLAWGMFVRARRQLVVSLRERAHRAEAEQQLRVTQARQLERTRIAREMHDVLAHRISLLSLHAGALEFRPDASPEEVARAAGVIRGSAHAALRDLREVIGVLRAETGVAEGAEPERPQPTLVDVPTLISESRAAGVRVSFVEEVADQVELPPRVGRSVYRIVQEGLTNARKHAPGVVVDVRLTGRQGDGLTVEIRNPWPVGVAGQGVGSPAARSGTDIPGAGTGLVGVAERVGLAGGRLEYGRDAGGHFRLAAWLPWPA